MQPRVSRYQTSAPLQARLQKWKRRMVVVATDTDVVVLAIAVLSVLPGCFLWVQFGHGRHIRFIAVHDIAANLGAPRSAALPFFHSFTCDTCSRKQHGKRGSISRSYASVSEPIPVPRRVDRRAARCCAEIYNPDVQAHL